MRILLRDDMRMARLLLLLVLLAAWCHVHAETIMPLAQFTWSGARYRGFFDEQSTGQVVLSIPPGAAATTQPLVLTQASLCSDESWTTTTSYDPFTTITYGLAVGACPAGPGYLIARMPQSRTIRWTYFVRGAASYSVGTGPVDIPGMAGRYRDLVVRKNTHFFDEDTSGCWLAQDPGADYHWQREDVYYACALFARGDSQSVARANATVRAFCAAQDRIVTSPTYGAFYVNNSDRRYSDAGTTLFGTAVLCRLLLHPPTGLDTLTTSETLAALGHTAVWLEKTDIDPYWTNFCLLRNSCLAMLGRILNRQTSTDLARSLTETFYNHILVHGAPHENNSPVYSGVSLWALKLAAEDSPDTQTVAQTRWLIERYWLDTALYYHRGVALQAGPYGRVYEDGLRGGASLLGFMMSAELGMDAWSSTGRLAEMADALHTIDMNPCFFESLLPPGISPEIKTVLESRRMPASSWQRNYYCDTVCHLTSLFTLGTSSASYASAQLEPFVMQVAESSAPGNVSVVFARQGATNDEALSYPSCLKTHLFALQDASKAIYFVDNPFPGGQVSARRALLALVADERFATWEDVRINGLPATAPADFTLSDTIFARRAGVFLAIQPLYANAVGARNRIGAVTRGEGHLTIALHAADSTVPQALAGKRLEAGFAVRCAEQSLFASYEAFISTHIASSQVAISETASTRSVSWDCDGSMLAEFDRVNRQFLRRQIRGTDCESHAAQSEFASMATQSSVQVRDLRVDGVAPSSWIVYPEESSTALFVNAAPTTSVVTTTWSADTIAVGPYERTRFMRPQSGVERWRAY